MEGFLGFLEPGPLFCLLDAMNQPFNGYFAHFGILEENKLFFLCNVISLDFNRKERMRKCQKFLDFLAFVLGLLNLLVGVGLLSFPENFLWSSVVVLGVLLVRFTFVLVEHIMNI